MRTRPAPRKTAPADWAGAELIEVKSVADANAANAIVAIGVDDFAPLRVAARRHDVSGSIDMGGT